MCRTRNCCFHCRNQDPQALGFAWSAVGHERRDLLILGFTRFLFGVGVLAFSIWSWAYQPIDAPESADFAILLTSWGLTLTFSYFLAAGLGAYPATKAAPGHIRDASVYSSMVLFVTAICFEVPITILSWSAYDVASISGPSLSSCIVAHAVVTLFLLVDFCVSRLPAPLHSIFWPIGLYVIYVFAAGMYAVSTGHGPYEQLNDSAGETVAAIFIALGIIIATFILLVGATRIRTHIINRRAAAAASTAAAPEDSPPMFASAGAGVDAGNAPQYDQHVG